MKALFLFLIILFANPGRAQDPAYPPAPPALQNINKAEYFIDVDPGFGAGTNIPVTANTNLSNLPVTVNTAGLSNGPHRLWIRTRSADGKWSLSNVKEFLLDFNPSYPAAPPAVQNLTMAEYFFDTDPGFGSGTIITLTPATNLSNVVASVNTSGLSTGVHRLFLRTRGTEGRWSLTALADFLVDENPAYPTAPVAPGNLVYAEYFFDTDPGFGKGNAIVFSPAVNITNKNIAVNTSGLADGKHTFYLRTLDDWSLTGYQTFIKGNVLPLRLLSFYARSRENDVALEWKTSNETGVSHFEVERSANGLDFEKIGDVAARNQSGIQDYAFNDAQPLTGKTFYRLKQVDLDGSLTYSLTVLVNRGREAVLQVFPNPSTERLTVVLAPETVVQELTLLDANARTLAVIVVPPAAGNVGLSLAQLKSGTYFIRLRTTNDVYTRSFIKL